MCRENELTYQILFWRNLVNLQNYEYCINSQVKKQVSGIEIKCNFCPSLNPKSVLYAMHCFWRQHICKILLWLKWCKENNSFWNVFSLRTNVIMNLHMIWSCVFWPYSIMMYCLTGLLLCFIMELKCYMIVVSRVLKLCICRDFF